MRLTSSAFPDGGIIPSLYTSEGKNISPPLMVHDVPPDAVSLVLIVDDPDASSNINLERGFDLWVVFNIPASTKQIPAGALPAGIQGKNTLGTHQYIGPSPASKEHRYFFKLYALNTELSLTSKASKKEVEKAMDGAILKEAVLIGRYEKNKGY